MLALMFICSIWCFKTCNLSFIKKLLKPSVRLFHLSIFKSNFFRFYLINFYSCFAIFSVLSYLSMLNYFKIHFRNTTILFVKFWSASTVVIRYLWMMVIHLQMKAARLKVIFNQQHILAFWCHMLWLSQARHFMLYIRFLCTPFLIS